MIVVDTNVVAYLYLPGELTLAAEQLYREDPDWHAPILWRSEFRNILAGFLRRGSLDFDEARALQHAAEGLLAGAEHQVDSEAVMELVQASDCSAYDCEFAALAQGLGARLVTMDARLLRAFPQLAQPLFERRES